MKKEYKIISIVVFILIILATIYLVNPANILSDNKEYNTTELTDKLSLNMNNWNYDEENNIYYQLNITYCTNPETTEYESLGIYVPGDYFNGEKNENGTYTCTINNDKKVGNYTSADAPIVMPINTAGYSAQKAPTTYNANDAKSYTDCGIVYVNAGCRGRQNGDTYNGGAPWGVVDLKSAIRYIRFNNESIPADSQNIFTFGHSGGGAQSAILGASGDSELYTPYLESIGAAMVDKNSNKLSDSVMGSMCWCPITNLDYADEAYEWNMGQYSNSSKRSNSTWTGQLSDDLASEYATYINNLKLKDSSGNTLTLDESDSGIYNSGSYYDYIKSVIEESLNNFLNDTEFPYTPTSNMADNAMGGANQAGPDGESPSGNAPDGTMPQDMANSTENMQSPGDNMQSQSGSMPENMDGQMPDNNMNSDESSQNSDSTTYNTKEEYINSLNSEVQWVTYNSQNDSVSVENIEGFVKTCKNPTKGVGAFDDMNYSQAENDLFGNNQSDKLHFDKTLSELLKANSDKYSSYDDYNNSLADEYSNDLSKTDSMNNTIETRSNMYNPMYYLCDYYDGKDTSKVAKYWRINSGIEQSDTALTTEVNLALALNQSSQTENVSFTTVWNQGHTEAERNGSATENFISWINECLK